MICAVGGVTVGTGRGGGDIALSRGLNSEFLGLRGAKLAGGGGRADGRSAGVCTEESDGVDRPLREATPVVGRLEDRLLERLVIR